MTARVVIVPPNQTIEDLVRPGESFLAFCGNGMFVVGAPVRTDLGPLDIARAVADGLNDARTVLTPPTIFIQEEELAT